MKNISKIKRYLDNQAGYDIGHKNKRAETVSFRTLYYKLAIETTHHTLDDIGKLVNKDHATVIHARDKLFNELMTSDRFRGMYFEYRKDILGLQVTEEYKNETQYNELKEKYNISLEIIQEFKRKEVESNHLTQVEKDYRKLSKENQDNYNFRVKPIMRAYAWKEYNTEFEQIKCHA